MARAKSYIIDVLDDGFSQVIKLPKAVHFNTKKIRMTKSESGEGFMLEPKKATPVQLKTFGEVMGKFFATHPKLSDDFLPELEPDYPPQERGCFAND